MRIFCTNFKTPVNVELFQNLKVLTMVLLIDYVVVSVFCIDLLRLKTEFS